MPELERSATSLECHRPEPSPSGFIPKESLAFERTPPPSSENLEPMAREPFRTSMTHLLRTWQTACPALAGTAGWERPPLDTGARCALTLLSTSMITIKPSTFFVVAVIAAILSGCSGTPEGAELEPSNDSKQGTAVGRLGTDQGAEAKTGGPSQSQSMTNSAETPN